ncbi:hypothetical protein [Blastopirellula marina]|uniref:DUF883 domain-containing protein n=1 Tax=Blastopirellula marina TaxID=124 RepID=A0A2S8FI63_9BACT|nr:hypothetical protein [Blastopirellula marina]PQO31634.1 hypothetical protein C5Y98_19655 [Blastopirellula marina]PTL42941.1 hypothetical protein C5Y97_19665 [Blastopirellula marina]
MSNPPPSQLNEPRTATQTARPSAETAEEAREAACEVRAELKQQACEARDRTLERGRQFAEERKGIAAEELGSFGSALRSAAESLESDGEEAVAGYANMCAAQLESTSHYLRERRLGDLYHDANRFARKHPEIFLGGMFLVGIAAARFLKASEPEPETNYSDALPRDMNPDRS